MRKQAYTVGVCAIVANLGGGALAETSVRSPEQRTMAVVRDLSRQVPHVSFEEEPFVDVIEWLRTAGLKNIMVRWRTLETYGHVDRETPVTVELHDMPLMEVLDWILSDVSQEAPQEERLRYQIDRGVIVIAPQRSFDQEMVVRVYDVEHLLQGRWFWADAPEINVAENDSGAGGGAGGSSTAGGVILTGGEARADFDFSTRRTDQLERLIEVLHTLHPDTWDVYGGTGTIRFMNGRLVINQATHVHEMIGGLRSTSRKRVSR